MSRPHEKYLIYGVALLGVFGCSAHLPRSVPVPSYEAPQAHEVQEDTVRHIVLELSSVPTLPAAPWRSPSAVVESAVTEAIMQPTAAGFRRGLQIYPYQRFAIYEIPTAIETITTVLLNPGERLKAFPLPDPRWEVKEAVSGSGESQQVAILIKPKQSGMTSHVTMLTSVGPYLLRLVANKKTFLPAVTWDMPVVHEALPVVRAASANHYQARIYGSGGYPSWMPLRVWDDGRQTFMVFGESILTSVNPVFFAREGDQLVRVNRTREGSTYRLHRTAEVWQIQVDAEETGQVVRIERVQEESN